MFGLLLNLTANICPNRELANISSTKKTMTFVAMVVAPAGLSACHGRHGVVPGSSGCHGDHPRNSVRKRTW